MERKYVRGVELRAPIAQDSYLHSVPAVTYLEKTGALEFHKDVTFLIGENGTGKSTLLAELDRLVKADSQLIIATHSPILMAFPNAEILEITESGIKSVPYRETEHYLLTRRFLEQPDRMLRYLLEK